MKQGSTDDPFAEDPTDDSLEGDPTDAPSDGEPDGTPLAADDTDAESASTEPATPAAAQSTRRRSLPYIHARDGVKDGRTQRPVFLRDYVETGIDDLVAEMEAELGEDIYKTDVTEAAMVVAEEHPELVAEKLREWGIEYLDK